jgi:hypothetical protein
MEISKGRLTVAGLLTAVSFTTLGAGTAFAFQEHMFSARNGLQQAENELRQAEPDKGGHRDAAIGLTQQAIDQVNRSAFNTARPTRHRRSRRVLRYTTFANRRSALGIADCQCTNC